MIFSRFSGGVLLGILGGCMPPGSPNPDPITDQKMSSRYSHPFSDQTSKIHTRFQTWTLGRNYVMITYIRAQTKNFFKCISNWHISISFLFIWNWNDNYVHTGSRNSFENPTRFHTPGQSLYPFSDPSGAKTLPFGEAHTNMAWYIKEFPTPPPSPPPPPPGRFHSLFHALVWYWLFDSYFF